MHTVTFQITSYAWRDYAKWS